MRPYDIDIWWAKLTEARSFLEHAYDHVMSYEERVQADRFSLRDLRANYIASRFVLRDILAQYMTMPPSEIIFVNGMHGKPRIENFMRELRFNLSHTKDYLVIAISYTTEVGVDIETVEMNLDYMALAKSFFSTNEYQQILSLSYDCRLLGFFNGWVRKEAYLKYIGCGLSFNLDLFTVDVSSDGMDCLLKSAFPKSTNGARCRLGTICIPESYSKVVAALAYTGSSVRPICYREWQPAIMQHAQKQCRREMNCG